MSGVATNPARPEPTERDTPRTGRGPWWAEWLQAAADALDAVASLGFDRRGRQWRARARRRALRPLVGRITWAAPLDGRRRH